jgi:hypothetical protein
MNTSAFINGVDPKKCLWSKNAALFCMGRKDDGASSMKKLDDIQK